MRIYKSQPSLFIVLLLLSFHDLKVFGNLTVTDVFSILFVLKELLKSKKIENNLILKGALWWLIYIVFSTIIIALLAYPYFKLEESIATFMRVLVGFLVVILYSRCIQTEEDKVHALLDIKNILLLHSFVQIIFVILFHLDLADFLTIVGGGKGIKQDWLNVYDYALYFRFGGVFKEPAWYAWYIVFCLGIILGYETLKKEKILYFKHHLIIVISMLFTYSISGFFSLFMLYFTKLFFRTNPLERLLLLGFAFILIAVGILYAQHSDFPFLIRVMGIFSGQDGSANIRIQGSFERFLSAINYSFLGLGIGNSVQGLLYLGHAGANLNGFLESFISTGILGFILYNLTSFYYIINLRRSIFPLLTIALVYMTSSQIFTITMIFFLALQYIISKPIKQPEYKEK